MGHLLLPWRLPLSFGVQLAGGCVILAVAFLIGALALTAMNRLQTPVAPNSVPRALVVRGPFRFSRNPIYVALVTTTLGLGVFLASGWIVTSALVLWVLLDRLVVPAEEVVLEAEFPADYARYKATVRRWL